MKSIISVLQDFEKLVYKILMWVILIPKTLYRVIIDPISFIEYIKGEEKDSSPFDEYISPVILLLVVALLPALAFKFLPVYGATMTSPASETPSEARTVLFEVTTDFKSRATDTTKYIHIWTVGKLNNDIYEQVAREEHLEDVDGGYLKRVDGDTVKDGFLYNFVDGGDYLVSVTVQKVKPIGRERDVIDSYSTALKVNVPVIATSPTGESQPVIISATDRKSDSAAASRGDANISEQIKQEETIFLALALMVPPLLFAFASRFLMDKTRLGDAPVPVPQHVFEIKASLKVGDETLEKQVKISPPPDPAEKPAESEEKPPAKKSIELVSIGEETLKQSFYVQCYYFSPLSLAIWATIYVDYFFTSDIFKFESESAYERVLLFPLVLCVIWFFRAEVQYFTIERKTTTPWATVISLLCIGVVGLTTRIYLAFDDYQEIFRLNALRAYPVLALVLMVAFLYAWYQRRRQDPQGFFGSSTKSLLAVSVLLLVVMAVLPRYISFQRNTTTLNIQAPRSTLMPVSEATQVAIVQATASEAQALPTEAAGQALATPTSLASTLATPTLENVQSVPPASSTPTAIPTLAQFYTEEFNGNLAYWFEFMTSGDSRMVDSGIDTPGKLSVELFRLDDKLPWYYLINDQFNYADVRVETVVINNGSNSNGVSLICRYSDIGWYEFQVSNSGFYKVYAVDNIGLVNQGYNLILEGGETSITSGPGAVNKYALECNGNQLKFFINDKQLKPVNVNRFGFIDGKIGISVASPEKLPVRVEFETLTVSPP